MASVRNRSRLPTANGGNGCKADVTLVASDRAKHWGAPYPLNNLVKSALNVPIAEVGTPAPRDTCGSALITPGPGRATTAQKAN